MSNPVNPSAPAPVANAQTNQPAQGQEATPDFSQMTGEQAKAWVEAQKAKESSKQVASVPQAKPASTQETIKEAAAEAKRKLKIGDEEVDEEEVIKTYKSRKEHQREANKRFQEGQAARKQAEEFVNMMRNPEAFFETARKLGHDPRDLAEKYLVNQLQEEMMDPRDKELKEAKEKLRRIDELERMQREERDRQLHKTLEAKYAKDYNDQFVSALKETGLPATKGTVAEMAKYIGRSAQMGFKMSAQEAAQLVMEDIRAAQTALIGNSDGEMLLKLLGEQVANKIREADMKKLKNPENVLRTPSQQGEVNRERRNPNKRMSAAEWREYNRKK